MNQDKQIHLELIKKPHQCLEYIVYILSKLRTKLDGEAQRTYVRTVNAAIEKEAAFRTMDQING